jgi:hypothetical protein
MQVSTGKLLFARMRLLVGASSTLLCLLGPVSLSAGDKIEIDRSTKVDIPKGNPRDIEERSSKRGFGFDSPELPPSAVSAPPSSSPRVLDRSMQELIDRKKNWLFYAPDDPESDESKNFLKKRDTDSDWQSKEAFRSKSERYRDREETTSTSTKTRQPETTDENPFARRIEPRGSFRRDDEEEAVNHEFNIRGYLGPTTRFDDPGIQTTTFQERNQYTFRPQFQSAPSPTNHDPSRKSSFDPRENDSVERRKTEFQSLLTGKAALPSTAPTDPLGNMQMDVNRREANPIAPVVGSRPWDDTSRASASAPGLNSGIRKFDIPRPSPITEDFGARIPSTPILGEASFRPATPPPNVSKPTQFQLEIPKRKF